MMTIVIKMTLKVFMMMMMLKIVKSVEHFKGKSLIPVFTLTSFTCCRKDGLL